MRDESVLSTVGGTPLVRLTRLTAGLEAAVYVKLESRNPGGSVKDRAALRMVLDAEADGRLVPGGTIIEPTSGNTGIGLALVAAARGYRAIIVMPDSMSTERRALIRAFGAELVLTPKAVGMRGAIERAGEIAASTPGAFVPGQFENPSNPAAHYRTTGPEIVSALGRVPDVFIAAAGTGGTVSGTGRFLREQSAGVRVLAVEPDTSPAIANALHGTDLPLGPHGIQGIGPGFVPGNLDLALIDGVIAVSTDEALVTARRLAAEEGLLVGISTGANVAAAVREASALPAGTSVVTVAPSTGERYLSTPLFARSEDPDA
jgi:cysteine synthase A